MPKLLHILLFLLIFGTTNAQIFECLDYQAAIQQGTRTRTGNPGPEYWQNHSDYRMTVSVDPDSHSLHGEAEITYHNRSKDTLRSITFRLYQNVYKKGAVRNIPIASEDLHDGVAIENLSINNQPYISQGNPLIPAKVSYAGTNLIININQHLFPKDSAQIYTKWQFKIPSRTKTRRMGHFKDGAYFIGLWYPQIAVYDDIIGWDNQVSHLGIQDFYNDFNDYEVTVQVPDGYLVWGTGDLTNPEEIYQPEIYQRLQQAKTSNEVVKIITEKDYQESITKKSEWHFKANFITDFAFGMAKNFLWEGTSIAVDKQNPRRVFLDIAYHPSNQFFEGKAALARKSVEYFSNEIPGYPFPFSHGTIFNGLPDNQSAVEYPMIANMSFFQDEVFFKSMIAHKLFHNYFPFYMGINEKNCLWMDEGWAFYIADKFLPEEFLPFSITEIYNQQVGRSKDLPLIASSNYIIENNLPAQYFLKPYMAYQLLESLLGEQVFTEALSEYIKRWHGKHPTPYDFFYTVEDYLDKDLSWLWSPLFFEFSYPDLGIKEVKNNQIVIGKLGKIPVPVHCVIHYSDQSTETITKKISAWSSRQETITLSANSKKEIEKVVLGAPDIPDVNASNNILEVERISPSFEFKDANE